MSIRSVRLRRTAAAVGAAVIAAGLLSACGGGSSAADAGEQLRLGYFPNVTHATALVGVEGDYFAEELGETELTTQTFNAGPAVIEALNAGAIDASYIGPNPAINGFAQSEGESLRIISGATSAGASLVVKPGIEDVADLEGKKLGTPQLGNTQDVALRYWLQEQGYETSTSGGGDVSIIPAENAVTLQQFQEGKLDGAWLPEPWASRLVDEAGAEVFLNEQELWPDGDFVTTHLIVRTDYLENNPEQVEALLRGHVAATSWINENPDEAKTIVNTSIEELTSKALSDAVIDRAWEELRITNDPIPVSLKGSAEHAEAVELLDPVDLNGIYDLTLLNKVLTAQDEDPVSAGGLGLD
jgi:NitT/TauT family transport system substrate-binding protein